MKFSNTVWSPFDNKDKSYKDGMVVLVNGYQRHSYTFFKLKQETGPKESLLNRKLLEVSLLILLLYMYFKPVIIFLEYFQMLIYVVLSSPYV